MPFDKYEKLIMIEKGVKIINWPQDVTFVNASNIGSFHDLHKLWDALIDADGI